MRNTSDHVLSYLWHVTNSKDQRVINIYPSRGTLQPGASQMAKVVFTAYGEPAFYDIDLVCEVSDISLQRHINLFSSLRIILDNY